MKKYIHHMRTERSSHERRQVALQIASMVTAVLFLGWVATLGVRLATSDSIAADESTTQLVSSVSNGVEAMQAGWEASYYQTPNDNQ
jgi:hypothetical protein